MQRNAKKCSEMQRDAEKCREMKRNEEKCREMQRNADMPFMTFMTHGNVIFDILELHAFKNSVHVGSYINLKNPVEF